MALGGRCAGCSRPARAGSTPGVAGCPVAADRCDLRGQPRRCGAPRIHAGLRDQGIPVARKTVAKLMKERVFVRRGQRRPDRWRSRWQLRGQWRAASFLRAGNAACHGPPAADIIFGSRRTSCGGI
ncbi:IS3 family transposase [Mangrovicoccus sp. HB161399]|uniref:IS3 family transposase n=1 Tax=Mangrovicoccus sp. HB161399 TaxID=2720392 RepID=UPI001551BF97